MPAAKDVNAAVDQVGAFGIVGMRWHLQAFYACVVECKLNTQSG